ncbi:unnamed protein product (macronuclear) [Paramecium tetraurelia]|uniref:CRC domain-containing protein n=1 Tax=Paramecium tetraurelia TaxID=5888 RepID=A0BPL6_PARTE|nr:uncharacterized protein GSPATT00005232001 [Paramecium tetraurelia]CAK60483.1 unnamed protein product [Paramecium tetraurelia]|eukprot:XP_001427881.1 hypothetical protein (macronuclear) [Paramecium tetraurelia strain d4-2]
MEQFIKDRDSTDKKSPQKLILVRSPNTYQKQNSPKQSKEEFKKNKIIKKLEFNDEFLVIKQDGIISRSTHQIPKCNQVNASYTLGLLNSIELNHKNEIINKLIKTNDHEILQVSRTSNNISCKCRKSKCIQNYCVCSANNQECKSNCECYNCSNKSPKSAPPKMSSIEFNGCNCRKQNCSKRYCECQKRMTRCTSRCNCCEDCENQEIQPQPFQLDSLS